MTNHHSFAVVLVVLLASCGGSTIIDPGSGGAAATSNGSATSQVSSSSVTTGPGGCVSHDDCPDGVCVFVTGQCTSPCGDFCDGCAVGSVCNDCATASCPDCLDCVAACLPIQDGQCDANDPCPSGQTCYWQRSECIPLCDGERCADPSLVCQECLTGSCCGCEDCVAACVPAG